MADNRIPDDLGKIPIKRTPGQFTLKPKELIKAFTFGVFGSYDEAISSFLDGFEMEPSKEEEAFRTVHFALLDAYRLQFKNHFKNEIVNQPNVVVLAKSLQNDFVDQLKSNEYELNREFVLFPEDSRLIIDFQKLYAQWIKEVFPHLSSRVTQLFLGEFRYLFGYNFRGLLIENVFGNLREYLNNDLIKEQEKARHKWSYYLDIRRHYNKPVLGDTKLHLADMYIEPGMHVHSRNWLDPEKEQEKENFFHTSIHDYILEHFINQNHRFDLAAESNRLLLLLGQPGQGKTSFCYRLIHDLWPKFEEGYELVFIKLRRISNIKDFIDNPFDEITEFGKKRLHFEFKMEKAIIILDGLDEVFMTNSLTDQDIKNLFRQLKNELHHHQNTYCIITSRYHYAKPEALNKDILFLKLESLNPEQQIDWLSRYKEKHPECPLDSKTIEIIHSDQGNKFKSIKELISQPILLNLVARANYQLDENANRAEIYEQLFDTLLDRSWSPDMQLDFLREIDKEEFRDFIGTIALKIFQSPNEYITSSELKKLEETKDFIKNNLDSDEDLDLALKQVLVSFYFQEVDYFKREEEDIRNKDYSIEFLHKSLQEYLAAEKIYNHLKLKYISTDRRGNYSIKNYIKALEELWHLVHIKPLSYEIMHYLEQIIENDQETEEKEKLKKQLITFFPDLLEQQFLYEYKAGMNNSKPMQQACNCFQVYWKILHSLGLKNNIAEFGLDSFIELFMINDKIRLFSISLEEANLEEANLEGANLEGAYLRGANLRGAKLNGAYLEGAYLDGTYLKRAKLKRAKLEGAYMEGAYMEGANLEGAYLKGANLNRANLKGANLNGAYLNGANMDGAYLNGAYLKGAYLNGASLKGASLKGAKLHYTKDLTKKQLLLTKSLYQVEGLDEELREALEKEKP